MNYLSTIATLLLSHSLAFIIGWAACGWITNSRTDKLLGVPTCKGGRHEWITTPDGVRCCVCPVSIEGDQTRRVVR